jgi:eukaryotic-like serine/threonine-protein kinase
MSDLESGGSRPRVGGRYELGELLGRGGMAEVRKGTDVRLGRVVAIKRLRTDLASDPTFQARFRREAQSSASLNHPAIVSVYDTGEETSSDGSDVPQPYIVMEYVAGRTLREILREGRKILPERALEITSGVLAALDYSHRAGIVHRDIKPANVMLTPSGDVKVMDFGIARAIADSSSTMTQTAAVVGTAQYLSPEQARGETVDSRSDVYSTGCLLYELLTGRPPFVGESPVSVAYQHVREQAPPPSTLDEDLAPEIDAIVMKALTKDVEDRYQSAAAMRADIERFLAGKPVEAPVVPLSDDDAFVPGGETTLFGGRRDDEVEDDNQRKNRWPLILTIIGVVALLVLAAVLGPTLFNSAPEEKTVPQVVNMTQKEAEQRIQAAGLAVGDVAKEASEDVPKGRVIAQDPDPLSTLPPGDPVDLSVSTGQPDVVVPDIIGDDRDTARQKLTDAGLRVNLVEEQSDEEQGIVIDSKPRPATSVSKGSLVKVYYSAGPREVPSVVGLKEGAARAKLERAGFKVDTVTDSSTESQKGTVLKQSPAPFTSAPQGTTVVITVSAYEPPSETPTPTPTPTPSETPSSPATETPTVPPPA